MNEQIRISAKKPEAKRASSFTRTPKTDASHSINSPIDQILHLQRTIGNQAVQRLFKSGVIQAKLKIGQPGDIYEQEADRVAEQVMSMPEPRMQRQAEEEEEELIQTKPLAEQITPLVQRQVEEEEEEELLQTKALSEQIAPLVQRQAEEKEEKILQTKQVRSNTPTATPKLESRIHSLKGGGQPLPEATRVFFEPRFGYDFKNVYVHTDARAEESARSLNAKAFTTGRDIVFGSGQYTPDTPSGKKLLAHELTHVVQQSEVPTGNVAGMGGRSTTRFNLKREIHKMAQCSIRIKPSAISEMLQLEFSLTPEEEYKLKKLRTFEKAGVHPDFPAIYLPLMFEAEQKAKELNFEEWQQVQRDASFAEEIFGMFMNQILDEAQGWAIAQLVGKIAGAGISAAFAFLTGLDLLLEEADWNQKDDKERMKHRKNQIYFYLLQQLSINLNSGVKGARSQKIFQLLITQTSNFEHWLKVYAPTIKVPGPSGPTIKPEP